MNHTTPISYNTLRNAAFSLWEAEVSTHLSPTTTTAEYDLHSAVDDGKSTQQPLINKMNESNNQINEQRNVVVESNDLDDLFWDSSSLSDSVATGESAEVTSDPDVSRVNWMVALDIRRSLEFSCSCTGGHFSETFICSSCVTLMSDYSIDLHDDNGECNICSNVVDLYDSDGDFQPALFIRKCVKYNKLDLSALFNSVRPSFDPTMWRQGGLGKYSVVGLLDGIKRPNFPLGSKLYCQTLDRIMVELVMRQVDFGCMMKAINLYSDKRTDVQAMIRARSVKRPKTQKKFTPKPSYFVSGCVEGTYRPLPSSLPVPSGRTILGIEDLKSLEAAFYTQRKLFKKLMSSKGDFVSLRPQFNEKFHSDNVFRNSLLRLLASDGSVKRKHAEKMREVARLTKQAREQLVEYESFKVPLTDAQWKGFPKPSPWSSFSRVPMNSLRGTFNHQLPLPGLFVPQTNQLHQSLVKALPSPPAALNLAMLDSMCRLAVTAQQVLKAPTLKDALSIIYIYVGSLNCGSLLSSLKTILDGLMNSIAAYHKAGSEFEDTVLEGGNPTVKDLATSLLGFLGVSNILSMVMEKAGSQIFDTTPQLLGFLKDRFVSLSRIGSGDDKFVSFLGTVKDFGGTLLRCCELRSIGPLFSAERTPEMIVEEAEAIMMYQAEVCGITKEVTRKFAALRESKAIPSHWTTPFLGNEFRERCKQLIRELDEVLVVVPTPLAPRYREARKSVFTLLSSIVASNNTNGNRIQPLGIAIVGKPGLGKTMMMDKLITFIGDSCGFSTGSDSRYAWKLCVNFQDGLRSSHWAYTMDDMDVQLVQPVAGQPDFVTEIMRIGDNKPFPIESADVSQKGTIHGNPFLFLYGSNNVDLKLATYIKEKAAVRRRLMIHAEMFAADHCKVGEAMDWGKAAGKFDIHRMRVSTYDSVTGEYVYLRDMTDSEFFRYCRDRFVSHIRAQTDALDPTLASLCAFCHIPVDDGLVCCDHCGEITTEGQLISRALASLDLVDKASVSVSRVSDRILSSGVLGDVETVASTAARVASTPARIASTVVDSVVSFGDFILARKVETVAILSLAMAALSAYLLMNQISLEGRVNNATHEIPLNFVKASTVKPSEGSFRLTTYSKEQMVTMVRKNIAKLRSATTFGHALRVGLDSFITNHHLVDGCDSIELEFEGLTYEIPITAATVVVIGKSDVALLKVSGVPAAPNALPYVWLDVDTSYSSFDSVSLLTLTEERTSNRGVIVHRSDGVYSQNVIESDYVSEGGDCGLPIIAESGGRWRVVAIHHAKVSTASLVSSVVVKRAPVICKIDIERAAAEILTELQSGSLIRSCFLQSDLRGGKSPVSANFLSVQPLASSQRSEVMLAAERGRHLVIRGHDPSSKPYSAEKTNCKLSMFYDRVNYWVKDELQHPHYWQPPRLKGKMVEINGVSSWQSGFSRIFDNYRNVQTPESFYFAIKDYVNPFQEVDLSGYAVLSEDEAILGVDGCPISSVPFATSVGPPYFGPKTRHMTNSGHISPEVRNMMTEILETLDAGEIPIVLASCTVKDEPLKFSKNDVADFRIFAVAPAAYNLVLKMFLAPIKLLMRNNPFVSDSMVGINMSGPGGIILRDKFAALSSWSADSVVEGDYTKMDKTIGGSLTWAVVEVFGRLADLIGVDSQKVRLLVWGCFHMMYSIHGDLYQVGGMNPSGCDITVEINAIANALCHRAAWAKYHDYSISMSELKDPSFVPALSFNRSCCLITYGDDFLLKHKTKMDLVKLFSHFDELGMIVTDGQKLYKPVYRSLSQVYFLKRKLYEEGENVFCGLTPASIYRMLLIRKPSTLSNRDHAAVVLEEAMREIFLQREMDFDLWRGRLRELAEEFNLDFSGYLSLKTKDEYLEDWENGTFSTWQVDMKRRVE